MQEAYKPSEAALAKAAAAREKMSMAAQKRLAARSGEKMALSVKQASKSNINALKQKAREKLSLKAYGATKGTKMGREGGDEIRDTVAPLSPEQHSRVQAAKRAATPAPVTKVKKPKAAAVKKPESRTDLIARIAAKRKINQPPVSPKALRRIAAVGGMEHDHGGFEDLRDTQYGGRQSYSEEVEQVNEMDSEGYKGYRDDDVTKAAHKATPITRKAMVKAALKTLNGKQKFQAMAAAGKKKAMKESTEDKDPGEYDYEGDMAMSQLKSIMTNAKTIHDMLKPDTNLPEWVQSKITLAEDYIVTAANYLQAEKE